jgi:hypothetical protein
MNDIGKYFTHPLIMPNLDCGHPPARIHTSLFDVAYEHDLKFTKEVDPQLLMLIMRYSTKFHTNNYLI